MTARSEREADAHKSSREELERSFYAAKSALSLAQASRGDVEERHTLEVGGLKEEIDALKAKVSRDVFDAALTDPMTGGMWYRRERERE